MRRIKLEHFYIDIMLRTISPFNNKYTSVCKGNAYLKKSWQQNCSCEDRFAPINCPDFNKINWSGSFEIEDCFGNIFRFKDKSLHCEDGPAIIYIASYGHYISPGKRIFPVIGRMPYAGVLA